MPQTSLYLDDSVMNLVRIESRNQGVSLSKYIATALTNQVEGRVGLWPANYWETVYGCLSDEDAEAMLASLSDSSLDASLDDDCSWFGDE